MSNLLKKKTFLYKYWIKVNSMTYIHIFFLKYSSITAIPLFYTVYLYTMKDFEIR